ncbi:MAG: T9SS type A sorting domain-containing protein [Weeksellaceae bacterium]|nr:T9SS type A sorting domain-containing protein [Weeksellaceae bacterium]
MKKIYISLFVFTMSLVNAQVADKSPGVIVASSSSNQSSQKDPAIILYNLSQSIAAAGNAGVVFFGGQYWVSAWASNKIHILSNTGAFVETIQIPGLTGVRSFTTDGTNIYATANNANIYVINPATKTVTGTITTPSSSSIRFATYDSSLDSGNGGFWIGNFSTNLFSIKKTGASISSIPAATHGMVGMYGAAVDSSKGIIYVYNQGGTNSDEIRALYTSNGLKAGNTYDVYNETLQSAGATTSLAGGLFLSSQVMTGKKVLIGVSQATPDNYLFGVDTATNFLAVNSGVKKSTFKVYPNPVSNFVNFDNFKDIKYVEILNMAGQKLMSEENIQSGLNLSRLPKGNYMLLIHPLQGSVVIEKVIKQ